MRKVIFLKIIRIDAGNPDSKALSEAAKVIRAGGIVIYPTETAYGIGAKATDAAAIEKVYNAKKRPKEKKLTVIVSCVGMAGKYGEVTAEVQKIIERIGPGPVTFAVKKKPCVPDSLNSELVFRVSSGAVARGLAELSGCPITATSANLSGEKTAYSVKDIDSFVLSRADLVLDAGKLEEKPVSTIVRVSSGRVEVIREGAVSRKRIEEALNGR